MSHIYFLQDASNDSIRYQLQKRFESLKVCINFKVGNNALHADAESNLSITRRLYGDA